MYIYTHTHICMYIYISVCMYVCMCIYIYIHTYVCIYTYIHMYTQSSLSKWWALSSVRQVPQLRLIHIHQSFRILYTLF